MLTAGPSLGQHPGHQGGCRPVQGARVGGWSSIWAASCQSLPVALSSSTCSPLCRAWHPPRTCPSSHCTLAAGTSSASCRCLPVGVTQGWLSPGRAGGAWLPVPSAKPVALALPASQDNTPPPRHWLGPPAASAEVCLSPCAHPSPGDSAVALFPPSGKVTRWRGGPEKWPWGLPVPRASPAYWEDISGWLDERGLLGTGGDWTEDRTRWEGIQAIY